MFIKTTTNSTSKAFTIVELIIVIVVIAILAAIVTVAYSGIQRRTTQSMLQNTARDIGKLMETQKVDLGAYPTTIPSAITLPSGIGAAITQVGSSTEFCINVTTMRYNNIYYSIDQTHTINTTMCPGAIVATAGDYNTGTDSPPVADAWVGASSVGTATAPGDMNFTATTNDTWSQITFTWNAVAGATQYRINQYDTAVGTWYVRNPTTGAGWVWDYNGQSGNIASSATSTVWTAASGSVPTSLGQTYQYRIQSKNASGVWSDWQTLTLGVMDGRTSPTIRNFKVTPNTDWTSTTLSWDSIGNFANLPGLKFRINQRDNLNSTWYVRNPTSTTGYTWDNNVYSGAITPTTTSQSWIGGIPAVASTISEYRIQLYSGTYTSDWVTFSLNPLADGGLPTPTNFTVTPNTDWTSLALSWNGVSSNIANLPGVKFRVNHRTTPTGTWFVRTVVGGSGYAADATVHGGAIAPTTTSQTWASSIPPDATSVYEYRIQLYSGTAASDWATVTLDPLANTSLPVVTGFTVTPAGDWSSVTLSWNGIGSAANLPAVKFRVNHRTTPTGTWFVRNSIGGSGYAADATTQGGAITPTTTSQTWTTNLPTVGSTHEYRIQVYSGTAATGWTTFSLSR